MRTPRAVNSLIDDLFERKYRKVGQGKKRIRIFFSRRFFCFNIVTPGKGSKYREFYDLSGRITCMIITVISDTLNEPCHRNTCLLGFRPGPTQTRLYSYRRWFEA